VLERDPIGSKSIERKRKKEREKNKFIVLRKREREREREVTKVGVRCALRESAPARNVISSGNFFLQKNGFCVNWPLGV
jgi:hypothetical protein